MTWAEWGIWANNCFCNTAPHAAKCRKRGAQVSGGPGQQDSAAYQELYTAVLELQALSPDHCPACETAIVGEQHVHVDPFAKAANGLEQLRELAQLKQRHQLAITQRQIAADALRAYFANFAQRVVATVDSESEVLRYIANPEVQHGVAWWKAGYPPIAGGVSPAQQAVNYAHQLENDDVVTQQNLAQRDQLIAERDRLSEARCPGTLNSEQKTRYLL